MNTEQKQLEACSNCGQDFLKLYPTPHGQQLCCGCFEEWFNTEEAKPISWVVQCTSCDEVVKGIGPEAPCSCGHRYALFKIY